MMAGVLVGSMSLVSDNDVVEGVASASSLAVVAAAASSHLISSFDAVEMSPFEKLKSLLGRGFSDGDCDWGGSEVVWWFFSKEDDENLLLGTMAERHLSLGASKIRGDVDKDARAWGLWDSVWLNVGSVRGFI